MFSYIVHRVLATIPVMAIVAVFVFSLLYLSPGDPAVIIAGDTASLDDIARIRQNLGLDRPFHIQFGIWAWHLLHGDLGVSIFSNLPVTTMIGQRIGPTVALTTSTLLVTILVAVPLGVVAAWKAGGWLDRIIMIFAVAGFSIPGFVLGYLLIFGLALGLDLLPVQGYRSLDQGFIPFARHLVLPSLTLGFFFAALVARVTRASLLDVLSQDYVRTAHAKGLSGNQVMLGHALRNAAVSIVTVIGLGMALLISGVVITETVFAIPGIGRLVVDAVLRRDYPVIQGIILMFSAWYVLVNLAVDLSYVLFDPRIRY